MSAIVLHFPWDIARILLTANDFGLLSKYRSNFGSSSGKFQMSNRLLTV